MLLKDKVCLVTGAAQGIGRAIAELFLSAGAKVYVTDIKEIEWARGIDNAVPIIGDICDLFFCKEIIKSIKSVENRLDVLVNNAGLISYELIPFIDFSFVHKMLNVNVIATLQLIQFASRLMIRQKSGSIINMASMVGVKGAAGQVAYSATKGAVVALTKSCAKELIQYGIRVNAIAPGMVGTERFKKVLSEKFESKVKDLPLGRLAEPQDIANACVYLASDASSYVTGQILGVDGGMVL